jgi:hypothetical protein
MFQNLVSGNYDTSREFQSTSEYVLFCARWWGLSAVHIRAERVQVILFVCLFQCRINKKHEISQRSNEKIEERIIQSVYSPFNAGIKFLRATRPDKIFYWDFVSWTVHFVNICVKKQQIHQLLI